MPPARNSRELQQREQRQEPCTPVADRSAALQHGGSAAQKAETQVRQMPGRDAARVLQLQVLPALISLEREDGQQTFPQLEPERRLDSIPRRRVQNERPRQQPATEPQLAPQAQMVPDAALLPEPRTRWDAAAFPSVLREPQAA
jgi:hypothetical protein